MGYDMHVAVVDASGSTCVTGDPLPVYPENYDWKTQRPAYPADGLKDGYVHRNYELFYMLGCWESDEGEEDAYFPKLGHPIVPYERQRVPFPFPVAWEVVDPVRGAQITNWAKLEEVERARERFDQPDIAKFDKDRTQLDLTKIVNAMRARPGSILVMWWDR